MTRSLFAKALRAYAAPEGSDYALDGDLELKVSEPAINQFSIIETLMSVFRQTKYSHANFINQGPYKAFIKWEDDDQGDSYETWTVDSRMIKVGGVDVNRVNFWIPETGQTVKVNLDVYTEPSEANEYGKWRLDAEFIADGETGGTGADFFVAMAEPIGSGDSLDGATVTISSEMEVENQTQVTKGHLYVQKASGGGLVQYTNYNTGNLTTSQWAYNDNYLNIQADTDSDTTLCKDRNSYVDVYMDYEVYLASDGSNVRKTKNFSFPVKDASGNYYYYQAYRGKHGLWGEGSNLDNLAVDAELTGADPSNTASYTYAGKVAGYLTKRTTTDITLAEIIGSPLQLFDCNESGCTISYVGYTGKMADGSTAAEDHQWVSFATVGSGWSIVANPSGTQTDYELTDGNFYFLQSTSVNYLVQRTGNTVTIQKENETVMGPDQTADISLQAEDFDGTLSGSYTWDKSTMQVKDANGDVVETELWNLVDGDSVKYSWTYPRSSTDSWAYVYYLKYGTGHANAGEYVLLDSPIPFDDITGITLGVGGSDYETANQTIKGFSYDGQVFGIPNAWDFLYQNRSAGDTNAGFTEDQKKMLVNIPAGTSLTSEGTEYVIKPLYGARILDSAAASNCADLSFRTDLSVTASNLPTWTNFGIGDAATISTISVKEGEIVEEE